MHEGWKRATLGDLADWSSGKFVPKSLRHPDGSVPIMGANGIIGRTNAALFSEPVITVGRVGACGEVHKTTSPAWVSDNALVVRPPVELFEFLFLVLQSIDYSELISGSSQPLITQTAMKNLEINMPTSTEQRAIVDLVGSLDKAIEAAEAATLNSAKLYQELLASMNGDPTNNRELGHAVSRVEDSVVVQDDATYRIAGLERSGRGFIDRGHVPGAEIGYAKLTPVGPNQLVYRKLTAWEGPISVADEAIAGSYVSGEFPVFQVNSQVLLPGLLRHICRWSGFWDQMAQLLTGSVLRRKRLNPDQLVQIKVPMQSMDAQESFLDLLDALWEDLNAQEALIASQRKFRTQLLGALLSGAHRIPETYDELMGA